MKHFYLIANPSKPGALDMAEKLETELLRRGASWRACTGLYTG